MNLKESFQYMNYLTDLFNNTTCQLRTWDVLTKTKETHYKSKAIKDVEDETIENEKQVKYDANKLLTITNKVMEEMETLSSAISKAKRSASIDIDAASSMNKKRQNEITTLKYMANIKSSETKKKGSAYTFNNDGNQTSYYYDVLSITTIDFNRNEVKKQIKALTQKADFVSNEIEKALINTEVDHTPVFDSTDTLEDLMENM